MRERVFLYSLVYSVAPQYVLEIGTFRGGSAYIISGALDDLALGGRLVTIDPSPEQITIDWSTIAHNSQSVRGFFPADIGRVTMPGGVRYDMVFVDGDHRYQGILADLQALPAILNDGAYLLLHDAYNEGVYRAIREVTAAGVYVDCGRIGRVRNDTLPDGLFGGFHLLMKPA
jgi:predicted O-methyltransferase YrrM